MQIPLARSVTLWTDIVGPAGTRFLRLLLDTGADYVTIGREAASDIGFDLDRPERTIPLIGANGVVPSPMFTAPLVRVQEIEVPNVRICVHDLPSEVSVEIDGLLGMSFLEHTIFTFDFKARTFTMVDL